MAEFLFIFALIDKTMFRFTTAKLHQCLTRGKRSRRHTDNNLKHYFKRESMASLTLNRRNIAISIFSHLTGQERTFESHTRLPLFRASGFLSLSMLSRCIQSEAADEAFEAFVDASELHLHKS